MKIITKDQITGLTARFGAISGDYPTANLLDQHPSRLWISSAPDECLRVACNATASALFIGNASVDSGRYVYLKSSGVTISSITSPGTSTALTLTTGSAHGLVTGDLVYLENVGGTLALNDQVYRATVISNAQITLVDPLTSVSVTGASMTAFTSGGSLRKCLSYGALEFRAADSFQGFLQDQVKVYRTIWIDLPYSSEPTELLLWLSNSQDLRGATTSAIQTWAGSGTSGRFLNGAAVALNTPNEELIRLGDCVTFTGFTKTLTFATHNAGQAVTLHSTAHGFATGDKVRITTSGTVLDGRVFKVIATTSDTFDLGFESGSTIYWPITTGALSGSAAKLFQITSIKGDGTGSSDVTLAASPGSTGTVSGIYRAVQAGLLRCGYTKSFANPQEGLKESRADYSLRQETVNGGQINRRRHLLKKWQGQVYMQAEDDLEEFFDFAQMQGPQGFPCLILDDVPGVPRYTAFCQFAEAPEQTFESYRLRQVAISLRELI